MRWWTVILVLLAACGDNARGTRLEIIAELPRATDAVAFDREATPTVRTTDGSLRRLVDDRWVAIDLGGARAVDFGSDNDTTLLVTTTAPDQLVRVVDGDPIAVGGPLDTAIAMPMQVPSGNRYVKEPIGTQRSFVLSPGAVAWADTPPMFFSRPLRAHDGTLYAATAAGVQRFEADGTRSLALPCEWLALASCTKLVIAGADAGRLVVAEHDGRAVFVASADGVEGTVLPGDLVVVAVATGPALTVVLAKIADRDPDRETYHLYARGDGELAPIDTVLDPPSRATRLAIDPEGSVYVATGSLARVVP